MQDMRIEFGVAEVKKWNKAFKGMTYKEMVKATGVGEVSLRNATLHAWGSKNTKAKLNAFCASKKQLA